MLEDLTKSMFAESVHSNFTVHPGSSQAVELELVELAEGAPHTDYEQFSLLFRGPLTVLLTQRSYELEHAELGRFLLFLVPVKQDEHGTYYESVFSRSKSKKAK